jgi:LmbE family N-acetylglucosaminyl deacetylase/GT2 family glycosyltransferase
VKATYPQIADPMRPFALPGAPDGAPRRVLVVAPHPDDEVLGCGGMLAWHARARVPVRVVIVSDGRAGDPGAREQDIARKRIEESRAAGRELGVDDYRFLGFADGRVGDAPELAARLAAEIEEFDPDLVYGPSALELHPDHRATARGLVAALERGRERRVRLFGVNVQVTASVLFDVTPVYERKRAAIRCLASQLAYMDLLAKSEAADRARTVNVEDPRLEFAEGFAEVSSRALARLERSMGAVVAEVQGGERTGAEARGLPATTAVISTWNKAAVVLENLASLRAQSLPFASIVVVDNASRDDTVARIAAEFPEVRLIVMPHSRYGACETFNIGFASVTTPLVAILDDDVTLPPEWLEKATARLLAEPATTAVVSTEVIEPGMPAGYLEASRKAGRRYMSTFRGCGSLARRAALERAGWYDERLFIYGNERDLTCRLLNLGYRVLQDPEIETFHKTPFGIQMGKRSLYFHARNAWLTMLKHAPLGDLVRVPFVALRVLLRSEEREAAGEVTDATGTIGIGRSLRETPGAAWILVRAALSVVLHLPYCLRRRAVVRSPDFRLPLG